MPQLINSFTALGVSLFCFWILDAFVFANKFFHHLEIHVSMFIRINTYSVLFQKVFEVLSFELVEITYSYRFSSCKWTKRGATADKFFYSPMVSHFFAFGCIYGCKENIFPQQKRHKTFFIFYPLALMKSLKHFPRQNLSMIQTEFNTFPMTKAWW